MLLVLVSRAFGCQPDPVVALVYGTDLPLDARAVLSAESLDQVLLRTPEGEAVTTARDWVCADDDDTRGACLHFVTPVDGWVAGATYTLDVAWTVDGAPERASFSVTTAADGHLVTPASGAPTLAVETAEEGEEASACGYGTYVRYAFEVTPVPDPDALSFVRLEREDGYARFVPMPGDGSTVVFEGLAPPAETDCFRATQMDGAGGISETSAWVCPPTYYDADGGAGCSNAGGQATRLGAITAVALLARRRAPAIVRSRFRLS